MKTLFLFLFILLSTTTQAQHIENNRRYDGTQTKSPWYNVYRTWVDSAVAAQVCLTEYGSQRYYTINLIVNAANHTFESGRVMLLKLKNGDIITLRNIISLGKDDCERIITEYGSYYSYKYNYSYDYYSYPVYAVTEKQLQEIIDGNVVKIRIETDSEMIDGKIKRNKFSRAIRKACMSLENNPVTEYFYSEDNVYRNF